MQHDHDANVTRPEIDIETRRKLVAERIDSIAGIYITMVSGVRVALDDGVPTIPMMLQDILEISGRSVPQEFFSDMCQIYERSGYLCHLDQLQMQTKISECVDYLVEESYCRRSTNPYWEKRDCSFAFPHKQEVLPLSETEQDRSRQPAPTAGLPYVTVKAAHSRYSTMPQEGWVQFRLWNAEFLSAEFPQEQEQRMKPVGTIAVRKCEKEANKSDRAGVPADFTDLVPKAETGWNVLKLVQGAQHKKVAICTLVSLLKACADVNPDACVLRDEKLWWHPINCTITADACERPRYIYQTALNDYRLRQEIWSVQEQMGALQKYLDALRGGKPCAAPPSVDGHPDPQTSERKCAGCHNDFCGPHIGYCPSCSEYQCSACYDQRHSPSDAGVHQWHPLSWYTKLGVTPGPNDVVL